MRDQMAEIPSWAEAVKTSDEQLMAVERRTHPSDHEGDYVTPVFYVDLLQDIRHTLDPGQQHTQAPGQPFFLTLISSVARQGGDPDWQYPLTLQQGVPLGVTTPTLTSPNVWPLKSELAGEDREPPAFQTLLGGLTTHLQRTSSRRYARPSKKKSQWAWYQGHSPSLRRQHCASVIPQISAQAHWQASMKETRSEPSTTDLSEELTPISKTTPKNVPQHQQFWTVSKHCIGSSMPKTTQRRTQLPVQVLLALSWEEDRRETGLGPTETAAGFFSRRTSPRHTAE